MPNNYSNLLLTLYAARVNYQSRVCDIRLLHVLSPVYIYIVTPSTTLHASFAGDITYGSMCLSITRRMSTTYYNWQSGILTSSTFIIKFFVTISMAS